MTSMFLGSGLSRVVRSQMATSRQENRAKGKTGYHTHQTRNLLKLRENRDRKDYVLQVSTNVTEFHITVQQYFFRRKPKDKESNGSTDAMDDNLALDSPSSTSTGYRAGDGDTGEGSHGGNRAVVEEAPKEVRTPDKEKAPAASMRKIRAIDLKEPEHRKKLADMISDLRSPTVGGMDPNTREMGVGTIKIFDRALVSSWLNGEADGFRAANFHLSDLDTAIQEWVGNHMIRHVVIRTPSSGGPQPADAGLSMGKITGFRSFHVCDEIRKNGRDHRCSHMDKSLRKCLRKGVGLTGPDVDPMDVDTTPPHSHNSNCSQHCHATSCLAVNPLPDPKPLRDSNTRRGKIQARQNARNEILFPSSSDRNCYPDFWHHTGLRGPQEACELVRRISLKVYRSKSNIIRNQKALEAELNEARVGDVSAAEWQRAIPTSQTTYLATYRTYLKYVLPNLRQIFDIYFESKLR